VIFDLMAGLNPRTIRTRFQLPGGRAKRTKGCGLVPSMETRAKREVDHGSSSPLKTSVAPVSPDKPLRGQCTNDIDAGK
jgi:hypothetical protein